MKIKSWIIAIMIGSLLVFATGCSKTEKSQEWSNQGVQVDLPKLQQELQDVTKPEIQSALNQVSLDMRYGQYDKVLAGLDMIANAPELNDKQKKTVNEVSGQVKQLAAKAPPK